MLTRIITLSLALSLLGPISACDKPCEDLKKKLCEPKTRTLKREYRNHCKLMSEAHRVDNLTGVACEGLIDHFTKR